MTFKEVGFNEYNKGNAIWKEKPCTMIEKVAISQCLREAYPKDYEGLYTAEELAPAEYGEVIGQNGTVIESSAPEEVITQVDRQVLFAKAYSAFGDDAGNEVIKRLLADEGLSSTTNMTKSTYDRIMGALDSQISYNEQYAE